MASFSWDQEHLLTFKDVKTHLLLVNCEASATLWSLFFHLPKGHIHLYLRCYGNVKVSSLGLCLLPRLYNYWLGIILHYIPHAYMVSVYLEA